MPYGSSVVPIRFFVPGIPRPGGSKKGIPVKSKSGKWRALVVEDSRHNAPWRAVVSLAAQENIPAPLSGAVGLALSFVMPRPKGHYGSGRNGEKLRPDAPTWHTIAPDATKLIRSTEDALKGIAWADDAQVASQAAEKVYANDFRPGCWVTLWQLETAPLIVPAEAGPLLLFERRDTAVRTVNEPGLLERASLFGPMEEEEAR